jgi:glycosyltransferase involved in cell wall biosynthesis
MFLYITEVDISKDDGPGINEREFISSLLEQADDVLCAVPYPSRPENHLDVRVHYVPVSNGPRLLRFASFAIGVLRWARDVHRQTPLHGVGIRIGVLSFLPQLLSRTLRVPIFLKTLAGYGIFAPDAERRFRLVAPLLRPSYAGAARTAVLADTVSRAYMDWLGETFAISPGKLVLVPNGANTDVFSPGDRAVVRHNLSLEHFEFLIGYVGALHGWRNLSQLLDAFAGAALPSRTGLLLVGKGPDRAELEAKCIQLGIAERVVFTGHVGYDQVPEYMRALDLAVDPTVIEMKLEKKSVFGSFSQKIPQYLGCGIPVLAWDVPDNAYIVEHDVGYLIPFGEPHTVSQRMAEHLALSNSDRMSMGVRARQLAISELSIRVLAARRLDLWRQHSSRDSSRARGIFGIDEAGVREE